MPVPSKANRTPSMVGKGSPQTSNLSNASKKSGQPLRSSNNLTVGKRRTALAEESLAMNVSDVDTKSPMPNAPQPMLGGNKKPASKQLPRLGAPAVTEPEPAEEATPDVTVTVTEPASTSETASQGKTEQEVGADQKTEQEAGAEQKTEQEAGMESVQDDFIEALLQSSEEAVIEEDFSLFEDGVFDEEELGRRVRLLSALSEFPVDKNSVAEDFRAYQRDLSQLKTGHKDWVASFTLKKDNIIARLRGTTKSRFQNFQSICDIFMPPDKKPEENPKDATEEKEENQEMAQDEGTDSNTKQENNAVEETFETPEIVDSLTEQSVPSVVY